jgi:hypothetical protein
MKTENKHQRYGRVFHRLRSDSLPNVAVMREALIILAGRRDNQRAACALETQMHHTVVRWASNMGASNEYATEVELVAKIANRTHDIEFKRWAD